MSRATFVESAAVQPLAPLTPASASDETHALGESIAMLAARIHAATYELLVLLAEFDDRKGWNHGFLSCAHWLHWRTGIALGASREKVRVARALRVLPAISASMQRGQVSYAKVRAMTRVATPANEQTLLDFALAGTAAHVERFTRAWRRVDEARAGHDDVVRHARRELTLLVDDDGMVVIRGRVSPEVGAVLQRALEAASDRLFADDRPANSVNTPGTAADEVTPAQRRADALALVAETALSAGLDGGTTGDRYQVVVHVTADASAAASANGPLGADAEPHGALELDHGAIGVSAETSRRFGCDASAVVMTHGPDGEMLDVGRKTRTIPPSIRRALAARDGHCRFPGCTSRRCDAHHLEHWADGGATTLNNLVLLCRRHHRAVHEGGFRVQRGPGDVLVFRRVDGGDLPAAPGLPDARWLAPLLEDGEDVITPPVWDGTRLDLAWAIDVLYSH